MKLFPYFIFILFSSLCFVSTAFGIESNYSCYGNYFKTSPDLISTNTKPYKSMEFKLSVDFANNIIRYDSDRYSFENESNGVLKWLDEGKYLTRFDTNANQIVSSVGSSKKPMTFLARCELQKPIVKDEIYYQNLQLKADYLECENKVNSELTVTKPKECPPSDGTVFGAGRSAECQAIYTSNLRAYSEQLTQNRIRSKELLELCLYNKKWIESPSGYQRIK